ncbi:MAG: hypothetical protein ACTJFC_02915 [Pseudolactococcus laudensis]
MEINVIMEEVTSDTCLVFQVKPVRKVINVEAVENHLETQASEIENGEEIDI